MLYMSLHRHDRCAVGAAGCATPCFLFLTLQAILCQQQQHNCQLAVACSIHHGPHSSLEYQATVGATAAYVDDGRGAFYPGTGAPSEVGTGPGTGFTVNVAWDGPGLCNADYMAAFAQLLVPITREYAPDIILVSAGFDAADGDPIGDCRLTPDAFAHMTSQLMPIAPCVLLLEGGYNLSATAACTEACLRTLLGQRPQPLTGPKHASLIGLQGLAAAARTEP